MKALLIFIAGFILISFIPGCGVAGSVGGFFEGVFVGAMGILCLWYVFIPIVVIIALVIGYLVEDQEEHVIGTVVWFMILVVLFYATKYLDIFHIIKNNFPKFLLFLVAYIVIGIVWSFIKLRITANRFSKEWEETKKSFSEKGTNKEDWLNCQSIDLDKFDFSEQEHKIFSWAMFWPFSILWFFLKDFLREVWEYLYKYLKNAYRRVYESAIQNIIADKEKYSEIRKTREKERERSRR
jgi:hypothetical protein